MIQGLAGHTGSKASTTTIARSTAPSWQYYAILAVLGTLLGVFFTEKYLGTALYPIQAYLAHVTAYLLTLLDIQVIQKGSVLVHTSGFACEITPGCTGLISLTLYCAAVLMYPARTSHKWAGLGIGILLLIAFNFIRLVHLVFIGVHHITWFDFAHMVVWQSLIALFVVGVWWVWTAWVRRTA